MVAKVGSDPVEIVRSFIETWNKHDANATMVYLDPGVAFQSPLFRVEGVKARTEVNEGFMIPPTGRHVEFGMAGFFRLTAEGKIVDERYYYDRLDLLQQLNPPSQA